MIFYRQWHRPKVISFDLDDTLYNNKIVLNKAEPYILKMLGENYLDGYIPNNGEYFLRKNDVLLFKGSRGMKMEELIEMIF